MNEKTFKDPVYGYITIKEDIVHNVIDTATFQRLRNIRQTSYAPLYPGALHNRFIHSLGVYYLGQIAFKALQESFNKHIEQQTKDLCDLPRDWSRYQFLFELACLLHDVGHSPFSHTGEAFYRNSKSSVIFNTVDDTVLQPQSELGRKNEKKPQTELIDNQSYTCQKHLAYLTRDNVFITAAGENPAAHEIMSSIVALEAFNSLFLDDDEKSFFARCITGIQYEQALNKKEADYESMEKTVYDDTRKKALLNCFIQLLHSSVIDVDRLDYIIRDAITIGYRSVSVDYERLLKGIVLVPTGNYNFTVGFHKNAISVIENAVYAHDNEKKWVQGHPTILYESYLLQKAIIHIEEEVRIAYPEAQSTLFSYDSLTGEGSTFGEMKVRYLSDADLIHLMKNVYSSPESEEYFCRNTRRLPLWKSEAEFRDYLTKENRNLIADVMQSIGLQQGSVEIDDQLLNQLTDDIQTAGNTVGQRAKEKRKDYVNAILDVCESHGIKRNMVLLSASFFKSNFSKKDVKKIWIMFPDGNPAELQDVSTMLSSATPTEGAEEKDKLFYLFYYPKEGRIKVDVRQFTKDLFIALEKLNT